MHGVLIIIPARRRDAASMSSYFIFLGLLGSQNSSYSISCHILNNDINRINSVLLVMVDLATFNGYSRLAAFSLYY